MQRTDQAIELDPRNAKAYRNRGNARRAKGDLDGAIEDYDQAIEIDPRNARYHNNRGNLRRAKGDLDGAIEDYDRAIQIDPLLARPRRDPISPGALPRFCR